MIEKENKTITALDRKGAKRIVQPAEALFAHFLCASVMRPAQRQAGWQRALGQIIAWQHGAGWMVLVARDAVLVR